MFLKSMICTQGFLYWIWGTLKNTNFLEGGRRNQPRVRRGRGRGALPPQRQAHLAPSLSSPAVL